MKKNWLFRILIGVTFSLTLLYVIASNPHTKPVPKVQSREDGYLVTRKTHEKYSTKKTSASYATYPQGDASYQTTIIAAFDLLLFIFAVSLFTKNMHLKRDYEEQCKALRTSINELEASIEEQRESLDKQWKLTPTREKRRSLVKQKAKLKKKIMAKNVEFYKDYRHLSTELSYLKQEIEEKKKSKCKKKKPTFKALNILNPDKKEEKEVIINFEKPEESNEKKTEEPSTHPPASERKMSPSSPP